MHKLKLSILIISITLFASCANRSSVLNPNYDLTQIERIGIVTFDTDQWKGIRGVEDIFAKYLMQSGFRIIERGKIDSILRERQIAARGYLSPETTKVVGKILGVDALIMGNVVSFTPEKTRIVKEHKKIRRTEPVYETTYHETPSGNKKMKREKVSERVYYDTITTPVVRRIYAKAGITAKLVDVETAEIIWVGSYTGSGTDATDAVDTAAYYLIRKLTKEWKKLTNQ